MKVQSWIPLSERSTSCSESAKTKASLIPLISRLEGVIARIRFDLRLRLRSPVNVVRQRKESRESTSFLSNATEDTDVGREQFGSPTYSLPPAEIEANDTKGKAMLQIYNISYYQARGKIILLCLPLPSSKGCCPGSVISAR